MIRMNQCKELTLYLVKYCFNRYLINKSSEEAPNKLSTVGEIILAHKPGKALSVLFQLVVRKGIHQSSGDICTRKKLLISYGS